jgi:alkanesulfonate monooxygenase SsuD/methylene tetrahydromethanopterin reductase-like flavin-dependent oxidoreductase (luciferase family)
MKVGVITEGKVLGNVSTREVYRDLMEQAVLADQAGFDIFGMAEQHFNLPFASTSVPEVLLSQMAVETERIRLRTAVTLVPLQHPLRVAEQFAALDIISNGRIELGAGRGNSTRTTDAFGVPTAETAPRLKEALEIIVCAWTQEEFTYNGEFWNIDSPVTLAVKPIQKPHPPLWMTAISPQSHVVAGELGLGLMSLTAGVTWDRVIERIASYKKACETAQPIGLEKNSDIGLFLLAFCAPTTEEAVRVSKEPMVEWLTWAFNLYEATVKRTNPEVDFSKVKALLGNWDELVRQNMVIAGDPDVCLEQFRRCAETGADEVLIRLDGMTHHDTMRSLELIGERVLPEVQNFGLADASPTAE